MSVFVRNMVLMLFMWLLLAGVCFGKQVFLKDGSIIDGQSAWRRGEKVFVKVNRDIIADFNAGEIDLRRTFPKPPSSSRHLPRKVTAEAAGEIAGNKSSAPAAATAAVVKSVPKTAAVPASAAPIAAPPDNAGMMKKTLEAQKYPVPQAGGASLAMAGFSTSVLLIFLAVCLLVIAGYWMVFQKAGQAGWKSLIPFYNMYVLMQISGKPGWWMFLLIIPLVGVVVLLFAMLSLAKKFGRGELFGVGLLLLPMIFFPLLAFGGSEYEG